MPVSLQVQSVIYHNEKPSLLRALESLANAARVNRSTTGELGELTVFYGDASAERVFSEKEVAEVADRFAAFFTFRYKFFGENTGSAKGHNLLGAECTSEYMMIMNPDVVVSPRLFGNMIATLTDPTKNAGMVEARQTPVEHPKEYDPETLETGWAATACAIFSTETFRALDGFDYKTFFLYCDDVDFSWRVRLSGKKVYYRPDCVAFHAKTLSPNASWQPTKAEVYYSQEASLFMAYKWSAQSRFNKLYRILKASPEESAQKVIARFDQMKAEGTLPKQLDPEHAVAEFKGDYFATHRFLL